MRSFIFSLSIVALLFHACKKEVIPDPPAPPVIEHLTDLGYMEYKRNGEFKKRPALHYLHKDTIFGFNPQKYIVSGNALAEEVFIGNVPFRVGRYPILERDYVWGELPKVVYAAVNWSVIDQLVGTLRSTNDYPEDYIEVIRADTALGTVEGHFSFHARNVHGTDLSVYGMPDSMLVSEGVFYLKLK